MPARDSLVETSRESLAAAGELLARFVARTGVRPGTGASHRYLWTDAFAVCTLLGLHEATGERAPLADALALVERVHETLGRHRPDDARTGWISGLPEAQGRAHPTRGGLRIGKPLPERAPTEPLDERREWERDGQYFHYLTRWMHALGRVAAVTGDERRLVQALELARAACTAFVVAVPGGRGRMIWKASIDLSRPLVPSMGQHDPLDGLLTFEALHGAASAAGLGGLEAEIAEMHALCAGVDWTTSDPLGLGSLLAESYRLATRIAARTSSDRVLLERLLLCAARGLTAYGRTAELDAPAEHRLAFRELGLAIGLRAVERLRALARRAPARLDGETTRALLAHLARAVPLAERIERFWSEPARQRSSSWLAHEDIDAVMLATSLAPDGWLAG